MNLEKWRYQGIQNALMRIKIRITGNEKSKGEKFKKFKTDAEGSYW